MVQLILSEREANRLRIALNCIPLDTPIVLDKEVTSEFGESVFIKYKRFPEKWESVDLTETDNF